MSKTKICIIGGGTAGITVAAQLARTGKDVDIHLFEPSKYHYYQPLYTLVGAGADKKEKTRRATADFIPKGVNWVKSRVTAIRPDRNTIRLDDDTSVTYDYLIICPGLIINWDKVEGLKETIGKNGVCSVYGYEEAEKTWETVDNFKGGTAIFTAPQTPVKCGGAPQKIAYLTEALLRKKGIRDKSDIYFATGAHKLFAVKGFAETLENEVKKRNINTLFHHELIKVDGTKKEATFEVKIYEQKELKNTQLETLSFDLLHVVPPQSAPGFIKNGVLATDKGWVDVDINSLQHKRFPNVFALGDVADLPTGKTGAAVRKQAPVIVRNICNLIDGKGIDEKLKYDGYSACPILTDYSHVVMAEFTYGYTPSPSVKFIDTTKPSYLMYLAKHYYLPWFYWNRMLKGKG